MDKSLEKINELLEKNKKWLYCNPTTSGSQNPYPPKIENAFLRYYNKNYKAVVSYETEENGKVTFNADRGDLENATIHAWFNCTTLDECFDTLEYWVRAYQDEYIENEELCLIGEIEVKSVAKK